MPTPPEVAPEIERIALRTSPPVPRPEDLLARPPAEKKRPDPPKNRLGSEHPVSSTEAKPRGKKVPELVWVPYPSRALLPSTLIIAAAAAGWVTGVMPLLPEWWQSPDVFVSVPGTLVSFQLVRWVYRLTAGCYALTATQLLRRVPGPLPDPPPVDLATVGSVTVEQTPAEKFLFVGRLHLTFERDVRPAESLGPVGLPRRRAKQLEEAVATARAGTVVSLRAAA